MWLGSTVEFKVAWLSVPGSSADYQATAVPALRVYLVALYTAAGFGQASLQLDPGCKSLADRAARQSLCSLADFPVMSSGCARTCEVPCGMEGFAFSTLLPCFLLDF